jgi:hypothetical protein
MLNSQQSTHDRQNSSIGDGCVAASVRSRTGMRAVHSMALALAVAFTNSGYAQGTFDNEVSIALDRLLPESLIASGAHRVTNVQRVSENAMEFEIESEVAGIQRVESIALALIRIHEARTLAQATSQVAQDNKQLADEGRGQINVGGDSIAGILSSPLSTSANLVGQFGTNVKKKLQEIGEFPNPDHNPSAGATAAPPDPVFASHRRSVASQLKLDVYSSNPAVQRFLDTTARARGAGRARAGVATISFAPSPEVEVDSGHLRERIRSAVLNEEQDALFNTAKSMLRKAQVDTGLAARLLDHEVLTLTHKSAMTEYLAFMTGVDNRGALIAAALDATNEVQAQTKVRLARMYAHYHESWTPLSVLINAGHLALAINEDGALLVALPFDFLSWTPETARIFAGLEDFAKRKNIKSKAVLLSGVTTDNTRAGLAAHGFESFERFLFTR